MIDSAVTHGYPNHAVPHWTVRDWRPVRNGESRNPCGFFMPIVQTSFMADWAEQSQDWPVRFSGTPTSFSPSPVIGVTRDGFTTLSEKRS